MTCERKFGLPSWASAGRRERQQRSERRGARRARITPPPAAAGAARRRARRRRAASPAAPSTIAERRVAAVAVVRRPRRAPARPAPPAPPPPPPRPRRPRSARGADALTASPAPGSRSRAAPIHARLLAVVVALHRLPDEVALLLGRRGQEREARRSRRWRAGRASGRPRCCRRRRCSTVRFQPGGSSNENGSTPLGICSATSVVCASLSPGTSTSNSDRVAGRGLRSGVPGRAPAAGRRAAAAATSAAASGERRAHHLRSRNENEPRLLVAVGGLDRPARRVAAGLERAASAPTLSRAILRGSRPPLPFETTAPPGAGDPERAAADRLRERDGDGADRRCSPCRPWPGEVDLTSVWARGRRRDGDASRRPPRGWRPVHGGVLSASAGERPAGGRDPVAGLRASTVIASARLRLRSALRALAGLERDARRCRRRRTSPVALPSTRRRELEPARRRSAIASVDRDRPPAGPVTVDRRAPCASAPAFSRRARQRDLHRRGGA